MAGRRIGLLFHGIGTPGRALEPGEAPFWLSETAFLAVLDRVAAAPDPARFHLSFDDGNASDHDIALPALQARGLRAAFFVLSGRIGQPGSLSADQIRALAVAGMEVGSHGAAHRDWTRLDAASRAAELPGARAALERVLGRPVTAAGIPFGRYDAGVLAALKAAGFTAAYSSDRGWMDPAAFLRPRCSLRGDMDAAALAAALDGRLPPLRRLRRTLGMAWRRRM
jgi:peptidoglycan/xylan/chitin deacetylase (PgdA/CDA1 family)